MIVNQFLMFTKKILCLGNNDYDTDAKTFILADSNGTTNYGLISNADFIPNNPGYYHTTILDIPAGGILQLAKNFDTIILLDQPVESWTHWKPLLSTYKIMMELDNQGHNTVYKDNKNIQKYKLFDNLTKKNKSFCIYPWIEKIETNGNLTLCHRSSKTITTLSELKDWQTDTNYQKIRNSMLTGELLPDYCSVCYEYESKGIESYRQFETKDWIGKLNINSVEELNNITHPYYYEIRLSNKCNIMCRSCKPEFSHLIEKEFKKFNIIDDQPQSFQYSSTDIIDMSTLNKDTRVYLTGGEPTIIPEVLAFMKKCIAVGKTDFDFTMCTNGVKLSPKFLELSSHFSNLNFSFSLDGYEKINDYWRWGSEWNTVIQNAHLLQSRGHNIAINCVPGIYNVTNLHLLFEFLDKEFPYAGVYLQINYKEMQSAYNQPNAQAVVESMTRCQQTKIYHSDGKSNRTCIDSIYKYYSNNPTCDLENLKKFFNYNDQLDQARGVKLKDYIPELEECRSLILD